MPMPTDRGYAVIIRNQDGTSTVMVATGIENKQPVGVFAKHVGVTAVSIDPAVKLVRTASHQFTTQIVEVFPGGGAVQVRAPRQTRLTPA
jgi:exoribonuclease II